MYGTTLQKVPCIFINTCQSPVVHKVGNTIHWIYLYPVHNMIGFPNNNLTYTFAYCIHNYHLSCTCSLNFTSLCFKLIITHYHAPKQREIKCKQTIKLNHNIFIQDQVPIEHFFVWLQFNKVMLVKGTIARCIIRLLSKRHILYLFLYMCMGFLFL